MDSGVGVYAPDAEAYTTFKELFEPILTDYHSGFKPSDKQPPVDLGEKHIADLKDLDPEGKYIVSTRIRCGRSIAGYPFNPCLTEAVIDYNIFVEKFQIRAFFCFHSELQRNGSQNESHLRKCVRSRIAGHLLPVDRNVERRSKSIDPRPFLVQRRRPVRS